MLDICSVAVTYWLFSVSVCSLDFPLLYSELVSCKSLFLKLKTTLKGCRFQTIEEILENAIRQLRAITESAFHEVF
jgi:hypothetical protein